MAQLSVHLGPYLRNLCENLEWFRGMGRIKFVCRVSSRDPAATHPLTSLLFSTWLGKYSSKKSLFFFLFYYTYKYQEKKPNTVCTDLSSCSTARCLTIGRCPDTPSPPPPRSGGPCRTCRGRGPRSSALHAPRVSSVHVYRVIIITAPVW